VLLFGGKGESGNLADTWIYNGENNRWVQHSQTDDQSPSARAYHDLAYDGRNTIVLFGGGQQPSRGYYTDLYEFNINENRWFKIHDANIRTNNNDEYIYPEARIYHSLNYIAQSRIVLFGGYDGKKNLGDTWIYTTHNNQWERADFNDDMARNLHSAIYTQSGKLIMCGGYENNSKSDTWVFDLGSKKWSMVKDAGLPFGVHNHEIARLENDIILMFGGINYGQEFVKSTYIYHYKGK
jgi:N-acetylneuraminic acid mutarotase